MESIPFVGLVAAWVLIILGLVLLHQLVLQNGRLLLRVEHIEDWLSRGDSDEPDVEPYRGMLPLGVVAPPIDLPDLNGVMRSLAEWRGRRVLLVFFDPYCGFSQRLLPYLVAFATEPVPDRPTAVIVSTGDPAANRVLFDEAGYDGTVLLQSGSEVAGSYRVDGTPVSYLIDADGTIAGDMATGVQATLILAGEMASVTDATDSELPQTAAATDGRGRISRSGLQEGETAPIFRLPRQGGGEVSLLDYRGKPVIVVFMDPECAPCEEIAPGLEAASNREEDVAIILISRGSEAANLTMVTEQGLSMPVALQRHWEISREYGIFAVPAAFYIDEWGVVASEVAVGPEAISELLDFASNAG